MYTAHRASMAIMTSRPWARTDRWDPTPTAAARIRAARTWADEILGRADLDPARHRRIRKMILATRHDDAPLSGDAPLLREVRAAVQHYTGAGDVQPRMRSAIYGVGGHPLRAEDGKTPGQIRL